MPYETQIRRTVIKVTAWKSGCIWKTKEVAKIWLNNDINYTPEQEAEIAKQYGGDMLGSMSTDAPFSECMRTILL